MAYEFFVTVDGIPGEATQKAHKDKISAVSYNYAVEAQTGSGGSGGGVGKPTQSPAVITKRIDRATPRLFEALLKGTHIKFVTLEFERRVGGMPVVYYTVRFDDVLLTSIQQSAGDGEFEAVAFVGQKVRLEHKLIDSKGGVSATTVAEWDWKKMQ